MAGNGQLGSIEHLVVLMLENRSFDHVLGYLYADGGNVSPAGQPFDGLTGKESNPDASGKPALVFPITPATPNAYYFPGADPAEGYQATNTQLFGTPAAPVPPVATNQGFVASYARALAGAAAGPAGSVVPGTVAADIMGMFTPEALPVISGLARGFAVCDQWFASAPTETMPNRAFACAATSQGHMDDATKKFTCTSIFGLLSAHGVGWSIYGDDAEPLTRLDFPDTTNAPASHFGTFPDFQQACASGTLAPYTFLEPSWSSTGNSEHPNYDVALGEQLVHDVYQALRSGPGWSQTLFVLTYDEHGGCYDHVPPPTGAAAPDASVGEFGFDFRRFGVRVPAVLVSPLIAPGTVFRVPPGTTPIDHTSILATVERRFGLPALTARDAAAPDLGAVLTLATPRTDDPLAGVQVPVASGPNLAALLPSHLQRLQAELVAELPLPDGAAEPAAARPPAEPASAADLDAFIRARTAAWHAGGLPG